MGRRGSGIKGIVIFLAIIGVINLLAWMFEWPFWVF